jgi:hypothetical protein
MDRKEELAKTLLDNVNGVGNIEEQLIKLFCLFNCCMANHKENGEDYISRSYIKEKMGRVISNMPIILDASAKAMYVSIMLGVMKNANLQEEQGTPHPEQ